MFGRSTGSIVRAGLAVCAFVALAGPAGLTARQDQALPSGRALVDKFVNAVGGEAAYRAVNTMHATGTFELPAQGVTGTVEVFSARPANVRLRADIEGVGRIERGYDGKVGWSVNPIEGPSLITGRQLRELIDEALFDGPLHPPEKLSELTTVERTTFDGQSAFKVKVVFTSGTEQFEYFAADSGLLIGLEGPREMPGGGVVPRVSMMRDYKQFGALKQPTRLVQHTLGIEQVVTIAAYEYDTVKASAFAPPPEVMALIKDR